MIAGYPLHPPPLPKTREYAYRCQTYPHVSQLDQAVAFLRAHRPFVNLVTINLGSNDVINSASTRASSRSSRNCR